jgi:ferric-dicitrate binding protein FerR (iron transport regulator)
MALLLAAVYVLALAAFLSIVVWARERRREREAFHRHETVRRLIERGEMSPERLGEFLAGESSEARGRRRGALLLWAVLLLAAGIGLLLGMRGAEEPQVRGIGFLPALLGVGLLAHVALFERKDRR